METSMQSLTPESLISLFDMPDSGGEALPLQNIGKVDWHTVTHAHGLADDIPALLRALLCKRKIAHTFRQGEGRCYNTG